jgi:hypothetical protein
MVITMIMMRERLSFASIKPAVRSSERISQKRNEIGERLRLGITSPDSRIELQTNTFPQRKKALKPA